MRHLVVLRRSVSSESDFSIVCFAMCLFCLTIREQSFFTCTTLWFFLVHSPRSEKFKLWNASGTFCVHVPLSGSSVFLARPTAQGGHCSNTPLGRFLNEFSASMTLAWGKMDQSCLSVSRFLVFSLQYWLFCRCKSRSTKRLGGLGVSSLVTFSRGIHTDAPQIFFMQSLVTCQTIPSKLYSLLSVFGVSVQVTVGSPGCCCC